MFFRMGSKAGKAVPPAGQALEEIHLGTGTEQLPGLLAV
jgi:hypothetical protein